MTKILNWRDKRLVEDLYAAERVAYKIRRVCAREYTRRCAEFAYARHFGQRRPGGELQIWHVLRVAERAAGFADRAWTLDDQEHKLVVGAAFLHDVVEDTPTSVRQIRERFGPAMARIVRAVSHEEEEEPDEVYLRRVATGGHLAVIVKRSDRLDNLNTLRHAPHEFRSAKLAEIRAALPLWQEIDPDGAPLIEELLQEVEHESAA